MKPTRTLAILLFPLAASMPVAAQQAHDHGHAVKSPADMKWVDIPSLPPGAKLAVLEGSLAEAAPFTVRLKLPARCWMRKPVK